MQKPIIQYSEAFKRQVLGDLESGKLSSQQEARRVYGIGGINTIPRWIRQYGKEHLFPKVVRVETRKERDEIKELKSKVRDLEKALAKMTVKSVLNEAYFEIVCEQNGIEDIEAMKKKVAALQRKRP